MLKKMENNVGARTHPCLMPLEMDEAARQRPNVLHLTLLTFIELAEDGEKFWEDRQGAAGFSTVHHG